MVGWMGVLTVDSKRTYCIQVSSQVPPITLCCLEQPPGTDPNPLRAREIGGIERDVFVAKTLTLRWRTSPFGPENLVFRQVLSAKPQVRASCVVGVGYVYHSAKTAPARRRQDPTPCETVVRAGPPAAAWGNRDEVF